MRFAFAVLLCATACTRPADSDSAAVTRATDFLARGARASERDRAEAIVYFQEAVKALPEGHALRKQAQEQIVRLQAAPKAPVAGDQGGLALADYGDGKGVPQVRPERTVVLSEEQKAADAWKEELADNAAELYQQAYIVRDRNPARAKRMFEMVQRMTRAGSADHEKARSQLAAMDSPTAENPLADTAQTNADKLATADYLKDTDPKAAARLLQSIIDIAPDGDPVRAKAQTALDSLKHQ